jgi:hypothetical protein
MTSATMSIVHPDARSTSFALAIAQEQPRSAAEASIVQTLTVLHVPLLHVALPSHDPSTVSCWGRAASNGQRPAQLIWPMHHLTS